MGCEKLQDDEFEKMRKAFEGDKTYNFKMGYSKQINNIITPQNI